MISENEMQFYFISETFVGILVLNGSERSFFLEKLYYDKKYKRINVLRCMILYTDI